MLSLQILSLLAVSSVAAAANAPQYLSKDVVIIGGGASGAHAAVRLREDFGKSIALIEKRDILGGHVDTFTDKNTGVNYDYGVQSFIDTGNATGFFDRLGIARGVPGRAATVTRYIDFDTGAELNFTAPDMTVQMAAMDKYRQLCEQWEDMLLPGYFNFPEPENIPEDLLLPFGEFVTKHGIEAAVPFIFRTTGLGVGDVTKKLTLYVMQAFGAPMARNLLGLQGSFVPASGRNQDVYDAVANLLGDDVLYSSTVIDSTRTTDGVRVVVKNSKTGDETVITARALLIAIEPIAKNTDPLDLDDEERNVFAKFEYSRLYAGIVASDSLPVDFSLFNLPAAAQPEDVLVYKDLPFTARFDYLGADMYFRVMVIGDESTGSCQALALADRDFKTLVEAGAVPKPAGATRLGYVAFEEHGAMHLRVSAEDLKAGFVQEQYALQGKRSTWYTGAAFSVQFQTHLWAYNDILLPKLVAALESDS